MIKEQFIQVENTEKFKEQLENGEISNQSIAFLKDTNQIWTQDKYYHCDDVLDDSGKIKRNLLDYAIDLSYRDINGNVLATQNTANCYVIKEPGTYKLPLVYGNAIKNGKVNTAAYTNIDPDNEYMGNFVNVIGKNISDPWIEKDLKASLTPAFDYITTLHDVYILDGYVYFTLQPTDRNKASAYSLPVQMSVDPESTEDLKSVIYGEADNDQLLINTRIAWQWTIWYYPYQLTTIDITNATGVKYQMLSENLAETEDEQEGENEVWFESCRYSAVNKLATRSYGENREVETILSLSCYTQSANLSYWTYLPDVTSNGWNRLNYWNAAQTAKGASDINVVKTVYDPCPVGFVVPPASAFSGMSLIEWLGAAQARYTRYSGDTVGIFINAPSMYSSMFGHRSTDDALTTIRLITSSMHIYIDYNGIIQYIPYYFTGTSTSADTAVERAAIPRKIRPIVEN